MQLRYYYYIIISFHSFYSTNTCQSYDINQIILTIIMRIVKKKTLKNNFSFSFYKLSSLTQGVDIC